MQPKSIAIRILYWVEIIISARILLFTLPVLLNGWSKGSFSIAQPEECFIVSLTMLSVIYLGLGIISLLGAKAIRVYHVISFVLVIGLTGAVCRVVNTTPDVEFQNYHFIPFFLSLFFTLISLTLGGPGAATVKMKWKSVLIVDDDETLIRTVRPFLMQNGYSVLTSTNGEEGLLVAEAQKPDIILLDVIMPGMKGREVCERLKAGAKTKNIPVVFLTSKDSQDDIDAEMAAGGEAHLTKPVNHSTLLTTIQSLIDRKSNFT